MAKKGVNWDHVTENPPPIPMGTAKKKKEIPNHTEEPLTLSKNVHWSDYISNEAFRLFPEKDNWRKRLIHTLYVWVTEGKDEKGRPVLEVMQFCTEYKIEWHSLKRWANTYEDVGKAYNDIKMILASRRRVGAHHRDYGDSVFKDMHLYEPDWHKEVNQYWSDLKEREAAAGKQAFTIEMAPARVTGKIKPKKEKE